MVQGSRVHSFPSLSVVPQVQLCAGAAPCTLIFRQSSMNGAFHAFYEHISLTVSVPPNGAITQGSAGSIGCLVMGLL